MASDDSAAPSPESGEPDALGAQWSKLMRQAQDGDGAAYRILLGDLAPYLRIFVRRYHQNKADVEDCVQDILLTIHTIRHTYDPQRPFKPWLVAIGKRRIIDRLRVLKRSSTRETALLPEHETFSAVETNLYEAPVSDRAVKEAVDSLPLGQRQAVTMLKMKEMSLKEASEASGMSVASLKVSTHRAMKTLRKILMAKDIQP